MIKEYFEKNCIQLTSFAKLHGLDYHALYRVVNNRIDYKYQPQKQTQKVLDKLIELRIIDKNDTAFIQYQKAN